MFPLSNQTDSNVQKSMTTIFKLNTHLRRYGCYKFFDFTRNYTLQKCATLQKCRIEYINQIQFIKKYFYSYLHKEHLNIVHPYVLQNYTPPTSDGRAMTLLWIRDTIYNHPVAHVYRLYKQCFFLPSPVSNFSQQQGIRLGSTRLSHWPEGISLTHFIFTVMFIVACQGFFHPHNIFLEIALVQQLEKKRMKNINITIPKL